jgi:DnaJ-class molecular chaperone
MPPGMPPGMPAGMAGMMAGMAGMMPPTGNGNGNEKVTTLDTDSEDDEEDCIFAKTPDICFELNVDLEDFYTGKKKKLNVKRKKMVEVDGKQTIIEEKKKLIIPIERGMRDEQQIRFEGEADQIPGYKPGDIIITLIENEHPFFQRDNDNLIIIKNINLYQNYNYVFDIVHLDSTIYRIASSTREALHLNDSIRKIPGLGMPCYKSPNANGDLFIRFNLVLPKVIGDNSLEQLKLMFKDDLLFLENKLLTQFDKEVFLENVSEADLEDLDNIYSDDEETSESSESEESGESEESEESGSSDESVLSEVVVKRASLNKK